LLEIAPRANSNHIPDGTRGFVRIAIGSQASHAIGPRGPNRGYHFSPTGLDVAKQTIANFIEKASRLYEQKRSAVSAATALEMYIMR